MAIIPGVSFSRILILLPLSGIILYLKNAKIYPDKYVIIPIIYMTFLLISFFYSYHPPATFVRIVSVGLNISMILVLSLIHYNSYEIRLLKKSVVFSGWLTLLLMIVYGDTSLNRLTVIVNGHYQDPNYLTGFLIFSIIYYLSDFLNNRKFSALIKIVIFLYFVLLTGSRGGIVSILASGFFYIFIWMKERNFKVSSILKMISIIIFSIIIFNEFMHFLPESVSQRFSLEYSIGDSGSGRFNIWALLIERYIDSDIFRILFGAGPGTVIYLADGFVAHNLWIESLVEIGIIGTTIFFGFYFLYLIKAYKMKEFVIFASFIGYLIMSLSMSLYTYKPIFNILLMIIITKNYNKKYASNS